MYMGAIPRGADVMKDILPVLEDLRARSEFPEKSAVEVVLIAGKLHTEWKGACRYGGRKMTTAKGVDSPAEAQHLLHITWKFVIDQCMAVRWSDSAKLAKCNRVDR